MHFLPSTTALLALLPALVTARIDVDPIPDDLSVGDQYRVHWSSDADYILELKLVQKEPDGWIPVKDIFDNREGPAGEHSYLWTVPNVDSCEHYGLWLNGDNADDPGTGYANLTNWFPIAGGTLANNGRGFP